MFLWWGGDCCGGKMDNCWGGGGHCCGGKRVNCCGYVGRGLLCWGRGLTAVAVGENAVGWGRGNC